jgi:hypothetical protein
VGGDALDFHEIPVDWPEVSVARGHFGFKFPSEPATTSYNPLVT